MKLAKLTIKPTFCASALEKLTITLIKRKDKYQAKTIKQTGGFNETNGIIKIREVWRKEIPSDEAVTQLNKLRSAKIPAFPISPRVCDGSYIELTIYGKNSDLTLSWWTIAPDGAEELADFADWLRKQELPDLEEVN
ncbi:MAG: hypothetical protein EXR89_01780 [Methylococcaceae bacterium]|nr:hypothetical protein [Methylococcaceae bacterium]